MFSTKHKLPAEHSVEGVDLAGRPVFTLLLMASAIPKRSDAGRNPVHEEKEAHIDKRKSKSQSKVWDPN